MTDGAIISASPARMSPVRMDVAGALYRCGAVIDLHCHVLAGIDDGPETIEGSVAIARAAAARAYARWWPPPT